MSDDPTKPALDAAATDQTFRSPQPANAHPDYGHLVTVDPEHYLLGREVARGGMGRILVARDRRLGRAVAVKELLISDGEARARFEREARITARLQHPSIVNVQEAGVWPSGEPFYAMALVQGRSLGEVIDEAKTLPERLALLPNVLALADAMAYAHGESVIHRDLKPGNVLVGAFGETVVIDWGLAKDLSEAGAAPEGASVPGPTDSGNHPAMTAAGEVFGTPAFMPPEQALGRPVDARADVYSLGAILHHVLSGQPPYTGTSALEILEAVRRGPPLPLATRQPGLPPELLALVGRAMDRDPAARYPTARELAEDLRRYLTGQLVGAHHYSLGQLLSRWLRRHRAAVSVAAVATTVLLVLGAVALQRILDAERLAEKRRGQAEDLLGFMLVDLNNKLAPYGRLDTLDDVAQKAVAYYEQRHENLSDAELEKRAIARRSLGDVLAAQGHSAASLAEYRAALAIDTLLEAKDPANLARQRSLSTSQNSVGDGLLAEGDTSGALEQYQAALAIDERLFAEDPAGDEWGRALSVSYERLGNVLLMQGDGPGALARYQAALLIRQSLAARNPQSIEAQRDLSLVQVKLGNVLRAQGSAAGALEKYRAALLISVAAAQQNLTDTQAQRDVSICHTKVGETLLALGNHEGALGELRAALAIDERLARQDPTNAEWQRDVAFGHTAIGNALLAQGDPAAALTEFQAALDTDERLAARDPTNVNRQLDVAVDQELLGDVLIRQGQPAAALVKYRAASVLHEAMAAKDPTHVERQVNVAMTQAKIGDVLHAQGDQAGALDAYRATLVVVQPLAQKDPTNADRQTNLSSIHARMGDALLAQGAAAAAAVERRASVAIDEALAQNDPTNGQLHQDVVMGRAALGDALAAAGDAKGAAAEYEAALALVQRLEPGTPQNEKLKALVSELTVKAKRARVPR